MDLTNKKFSCQIRKKFPQLILHYPSQITTNDSLLQSHFCQYPQYYCHYVNVLLGFLIIFLHKVLLWPVNPVNQTPDWTGKGNVATENWKIFTCQFLVFHNFSPNQILEESDKVSNIKLEHAAMKYSLILVSNIHVSKH